MVEAGTVGSGLVAGTLAGMAGVALAETGCPGGTPLVERGNWSVVLLVVSQVVERRYSTLERGGVDTLVVQLPPVHVLAWSSHAKIRPRGYFLSAQLSGSNSRSDLGRQWICPEPHVLQSLLGCRSLQGVDPK